MSNISDLIEEFILDALSQDEMLKLSRNELASFFGCSPSQINYVLSTRFTLDRGFDIESQRGGGGFIRLVRLSTDKGSLINKLVVERLIEPIDYLSAKQIAIGLCEQDIITPDELNIILSAISPKALATPVNIENHIRSQVLKNILVNKEINRKGGN